MQFRGDESKLTSVDELHTNRLTEKDEYNVSSVRSIERTAE